MVNPIRFFPPHQRFTERFGLIAETFAYAKEYNRIDVDLCFEGMDLEARGVNSVLRLVADTCDIPYNRVSIRNNCNLLTNVSNPFADPYHLHSIWSKMCRGAEVTHNKDIKYKFSSFVGRPTWDRLQIASWLFKQDLRIMSFNAAPVPFRNKPPGIHFDELCDRYIPSFNPKQVTELIDHLPIQLQPTSELMSLDSITLTELLALNGFYNNVFLDIVNETSTDGRVFFPTEKIFRPIMYKTPFIVFGPQHFLHNLRKFGFETFNEYWSEHYDCVLADNTRLTTLIAQLTKINKLPLGELKEMHKKMQPILDHNYNVLQNLRKVDYKRETFDE